jgi:ribosomal protein L11 methyltransferase
LKKYYYELEITPNLYYELFLDLVSALTDEALEERDGTIIIRSEEELDTIQVGVDTFAKELSNAFSTEITCEISLSKKENIDWVKEYQNSVQPIEVGSFYVTPSWHSYKDIKDKHIIKVDPTLSFGSGHHETTNSCLQAIDKYVQEKETLCDVGSGSGILAIAAAKKGAIIDICDTDEVAVEDAIKNFELNEIFPNNSWVGSINKCSAQYDIVVANIVADVLTMISNDLIKAVKTGGILILSGIIEQYSEKVRKKYENRCELIEEISQNEWKTFVFKKIKN